MNKASLYQIVKPHIDQMDYYGLLASGAPKDEFDSEIQEICRRIRAEQSAAEIAEVIADVFNKNFDEANSMTDFLSVAEQIKDAMHKDLSCI